MLHLGNWSGPFKPFKSGTAAGAPCSSADNQRLGPEPSHLRPPNPRVQRTRPCASLRGSPLTRHPLGGFMSRFWLASVLLLAALPGCETFNGKRYIAILPPPSRSTATCEVTSEHRPSVVIEVRDDSGSPLPGALVRLTPAAGGTATESATDRRGVATARLEPGTWRVDTTLPGFTSGHHSVDLSPGQVCTVQFMVRIDSRGRVVVT